ncbi:MAG: purine-nucleoside phosphorylase [Alphaproteobacteria bacterium]|nr:purine-nucleoside phosphorylase [Alphaproteobacteria bacterium]
MSQNAYLIAEQIKAKSDGLKSEILVILGSGLGDFVNEINVKKVIDYSEINGFPVSTVSGHQGKLVYGEVSGKCILCMQGRFHLYEGYSPSLIADVIKAFKLIGIKHMIVTNAAGSLRKEVKPGSLMLIKDHINMSGFNPLIGTNDESFGPRFPNMNNVYSDKFREVAKKIAKNYKIELHEGVYCMLSGPVFETPSEVKMCSIIGADANGMSTVPEAMTAAYCGIDVLGISAITNYCTGIEGGCPTHAETLQNAAKTAKNMTLLVSKFIGEI